MAAMSTSLGAASAGRRAARRQAGGDSASGRSAGEGVPGPQNSIKYLHLNTHIAPAGVILKMRIQLRGHPGGGLGAPAV
jgi:hypothetical protein